MVKIGVPWGVITSDEVGDDVGCQLPHVVHRRRELRLGLNYLDVLAMSSVRHANSLVDAIDRRNDLLRLVKRFLRELGKLARGLVVINERVS